MIVSLKFGDESFGNYTYLSGSGYCLIVSGMTAIMNAKAVSLEERESEAIYRGLGVCSLQDECLVTELGILNRLESIDISSALPADQLPAMLGFHGEQ